MLIFEYGRDSQKPVYVAHHINTSEAKPTLRRSMTQKQRSRLWDEAGTQHPWILQKRGSCNIGAKPKTTEDTGKPSESEELLHPCESAERLQLWHFSVFFSRKALFLRLALWLEDEAIGWLMHPKSMDKKTSVWNDGDIVTMEYRCCLVQGELFIWNKKTSTLHLCTYSSKWSKWKSIWNDGNIVAMISFPPCARYLYRTQKSKYERENVPHVRVADTRTHKHTHTHTNTHSLAHSLKRPYTHMHAYWHMPKRL
jgi:hypothetical protein